MVIEDENGESKNQTAGVIVLVVVLGVTMFFMFRALKKRKK